MDELNRQKRKPNQIFRDADEQEWDDDDQEGAESAAGGAGSGAGNLMMMKMQHKSNFAMDQYLQEHGDETLDPEFLIKVQHQLALNSATGGDS